MIAEAIREANPEWTKILVDLQTIRWTNRRTKMRYIALTPEIAAAALVNFDQGREIEPFSFRLRTFQRTPVVERLAPEDREQLVLDGAEKAPKTRQRRGRKKVALDHHGEVVVEGGRPMPGGHLRGSATPGKGTAGKKPKASNVQLSRTGARVFGRRLLRG